MIVYRISWTAADHEHRGYTWCSSRSKAEALLTDKNVTGTIEEITIRDGKAALLDALNKYAGHPDNG